MLKAGEKAPAFKLNDQNGRPVIAFRFCGAGGCSVFLSQGPYPRLYKTSLCLCGTLRRISEKECGGDRYQQGQRILPHQICRKAGLPFILLADPDLEAIQAYGVWQEKKLYGKLSYGVVRTTFIIDENGCIEKVLEKVKPDTNAGEVLALL